MLQTHLITGICIRSTQAKKLAVPTTITIWPLHRQKTKTVYAIMCTRQVKTVWTEPRFGLYLVLFR